MGRKQAVARRKANEASYQTSRFNALKHGVLSKHTVLPWEDRDEYDVLLGAVAAEFSPVGPTEEHLVEELAGIVWRKRRLRLAEAATFRRGLKHAIGGSSFDTHNPSVAAALAGVGRDLLGKSQALTDVIHRDPGDLAEEASDVRAAMKRVEKVVMALQDGNEDAYDRALGVLYPDTREWWEETVEEWAEESAPEYTPTAESLAEWIEREAQPYFQDRLLAINSREAIREQVFGDSFKPEQLESLARYETHLDRKLERTLAMLVKLQEIRRQRDLEEPPIRDPEEPPIRGVQ